MNVPPNTSTEPREIKRLNRAATDFLYKNDKPAKFERFKAAKKQEKAARQARLNPALVRSYQKALRLAR